MAKKLSFDNLPEAMARVLEILSAEGSEHAVLPELVRRIALLEKKIDYLQQTLSPERPVMDMPTVCRVLKLRPKAVNELAMSGVLPGREQGRKTVFYEDGVLRYFMTTPAWKEAAAPKSGSAKAAGSKSGPDEAPVVLLPEGRQRIGVQLARQILDRSPGAIYQLTSNDRIPYHKDGTKVYFYTDELREWVKTNPAHHRKPRK